MDTEVAAARQLLSDCVEVLRSEIVREASRSLAEARARAEGRFGMPDAGRNPLVRFVFAELDARARLISDIGGGGWDVKDREHIMHVARRRLERSHPDAARSLSRAERADASLLAILEGLRAAEPRANYSLFDGKDVAAVLTARDPAMRGVRVAVVEDKSREIRRIVVIDDPSWPERKFVRLHRGDAGPNRPRLEYDNIVVADAQADVDDTLPIEHSLDTQFAELIHARSDIGRWMEDGITDDVVLALRQEKDARDFQYRVGTMSVAVRLHIFKQSGPDEARYGDLTLIVERLVDQGLTSGVAVVEAKKRDIFTGDLRALRTKQADNILQYAPAARLLIYDFRGQPGWHLVVVPLERYAELRGGGALDLTALGTSFSRQLTRRYFLGHDLETAREDVHGAVWRGTRYVAHASVGVGYGPDFAQERLAQLRPRYLEIIERELGVRERENIERNLAAGRERPRPGWSHER